jgi:glycosyltransferase involved in cell wall biosynthesis
MKVLIVTQYYWPEVFHINEVAASLVAEGCSVDVLTGKPNYPSGRIFNDYKFWGVVREAHSGVRIFRVPVAPRGSGGALRLIWNYLSFVFMGVLLGPWVLRRRDYDVIFVYAPSPILQALPAILLSRIKRCKTVIWIQDLWPESLEATGYLVNRFALKLVKKVVRWIYRRSDLLLVQSRAFIPSVSAMAPGKRIIYHPNSVDDIFILPTDPSVVLPSIPALNEGFSILFAGNVGTGQALDGILNAAELLLGYPQISLVLLGKGSRWEWMKREVTKRKLINIHMPGRFPLRTMPGLMQRADALLVTLDDKPVFALTVPNKIQAYLAVGKPIVACLNGEGARIVEEADAGLTVPPNDGPKLAAAILKLYRLPFIERDKLGRNGKCYFNDKFHHQKLVKELINDLLKPYWEGKS